jgi:hypothetical protein
MPPLHTRPPICPTAPTRVTDVGGSQQWHMHAFFAALANNMMTLANLIWTLSGRIITTSDAFAGVGNGIVADDYSSNAAQKVYNSMLVVTTCYYSLYTHT